MFIPPFAAVTDTDQAREMVAAARSGWLVTSDETGLPVATLLTGTVRVETDHEWLRQAVTELTRAHEEGRAERWAVSDAPDDYIDQMLRGIVGVEFTVTGVQAKAKLSQNRPEVDREGVIEGLRAEDEPGAHAVASAMESMSNRS